MGDIVGRPILPTNLDRVLGKKFVSESQLRENAGLTKHQSNKSIGVLIERGLLQKWVAPKCLACAYVWPEYPSEDDIEEEIFCPLCNETTPSEFITFYDVYKVMWEGR